MDANLSSKIEIYVQCSNLVSHDLLSKSDPFVVLYLRGISGQFEQIGRSETIKNSENPKFSTQFKIEYFFEENQEIRVEIYDTDTASQKLSEQDFIGNAVFPVGEMVASPGQAVTKAIFAKGSKKPIMQHSKPSTVTLSCEEISLTNDLVYLNLAATGLPKMDMFGSADPYLEIFRSREDGSWIKIHKTEVIKNNPNPTWKQISISSQQLCNGDYARPLLIKCFDWDRNSDPDLIGQCQCSVNDMKENNFSQSLQRPKKKKTYGKFAVRNLRIARQHSFMDYLKGGCQISLMVAIDYTGSNGNPTDPRSLHYMNSQSPNEYIRAMSAIGTVLAPYDTDQQFPVWGFGAKIGSQTSHCFSLTFDERNPEVRGIPGIIDVYQRSFQKVALSGPTLFQHILQTASDVAKQQWQTDCQNYYIFLILTDGVINDLQKTVDVLVAASGLPLSVIIVGVGQADFRQMDHLDADGGQLKSSNGRFAERDIVQFVPFRRFDGQQITRLSKETLAELPGQFLAYMRSKKISPLDPAVRIARMRAQQQQHMAQLPQGGGSGSNGGLTVEQQIHQAHMATLAAQQQTHQARAGLASLQVSESKDDSSSGAGGAPQQGMNPPMMGSSGNPQLENLRVNPPQYVSGRDIDVPGDKPPSWSP
uniref:Copine-3-like isoform X2 n=2 Tax=Hirondellea gigas TaxID=1518452 RepID=A0A6A7G4L2_9CRUS